MCQVPVIVIQPETVDRGYGLPECLREVGFTNVTSIGVGPEVLADPHVSALVDQRGARIHSGASLTREQVACFVSHQRAQAQGSMLKDPGWLIILEDDAQVRPGLHDFAVALSTLNYARPAIISLFSDGRVVPSRRHAPVVVGPAHVRRLEFPPAYAVGYAMNLEASRLSERYQGWPIFCRADWPPWASQADFFITDPLLVGHTLGDSTMTRIAASPRGMRRGLRTLAKATGFQFLVSARSYRGDLPLYWRHALRPSILNSLHSLRRRPVHISELTGAPDAPALPREAGAKRAFDEG